MTIPNVAQCQAYHLFGVDQASSVANIVNPAAPLNVNGSPAYESNCAVLTGNTGVGYSTPFTGTPYNRTCIIFGTADYDSIATPGAPTAATQFGTLAFMSWNSNAQFVYYFGASLLWRQGAHDLQPTTTPPGHWFFPDGTQRRGPYVGIIVTEDAINDSLWFLDGTAFEKTTTPIGTSPPAIAASVTRLGLGGHSANTTWRVAAFAQFSALTDSQALASAAYMQADLAARGIRDF